MPETLPQLPAPSAPASVPRQGSTTRLRHRLVAVLGVLALVLAACSSGSAAAVTVGSRSIDESTVKSELATITKNPTVKQQAVVKGKLDPSIVAAWVTLLVESQVAREAIEKAGEKVTADDLNEAKSWAAGYFGNEQTWSAFPKTFQAVVTNRYAYIPAYVRTHTKAPTDADVRKAYDQSLVRNCPSRHYVSHILLGSEASAQAAAAELAAGADFKQVAAKSSTDTQSSQRGGALGCIDGQQIDATFAAAAAATPVGQVSAPVHTQYGWHIIKVEDVETALPFDSVKVEVRRDLVEQGPQGRAALRKLTAAAKVKVDARYGRWVVKGGQGRVDPPTTSTTTTKPAATSSTTTTTKP
jgi:parvulin-like peptidyl-prolyl isomerase